MTVQQRHRNEDPPLSPDTIASRIRTVRGQRVLLDEDLARLYSVPTKAINQAVARNPDRFPADFAFPLSREEVAHSRSQSVTSSWGGRRHAWVAFTEQGVAMLSSVLRSPRATLVNIAIMRAFVQLRRLLVDHAELASRVAELEAKFDQHDERIACVFAAIQQLLEPDQTPGPPRDRIGFERAKDAALPPTTPQPGSSQP